MSRERVHRILGLCVSQNQLVTKFSSVKHNTSFSSPPPPDFYSIKHHSYFLSLVAFQKKRKKKKKQHTQMSHILDPLSHVQINISPPTQAVAFFSVNTDSSGRSHSPCYATWSTRWRKWMAVAGTCWLSQLRLRRPSPLRGSLPACDLATALSFWFLSSKSTPPGFRSFMFSPSRCF